MDIGSVILIKWNEGDELEHTNCVCAMHHQYKIPKVNANVFIRPVDCAFLSYLMDDSHESPFNSTVCLSYFITLGKT